MKRLVGLFVGTAGELKKHAEEVLGERVHLPVTCECMTTEEEIKAYEERTGITLDAHNRATLRGMIEKDNRFWEKQWLHEELQAKYGEERFANHEE